MKSIELTVTGRDTSASTRAARRDGRIPGIIYGAGGPNVAVEVNAREFSRTGLSSHGAHLISINPADDAFAGGLALIREIQTHPVSGRPTHVDFLRIDETKPVTANVALSFVGKPAGVVEGGILQPIRRELEVTALPSVLPTQIEVDVSELGIHDSIHVEELEWAEGVSVSFHENFTLVTVVPPVVEKVEDEAEEGIVEGEEGVAGDEPAADEAGEDEKGE